MKIIDARWGTVQQRNWLTYKIGYDHVVGVTRSPAIKWDASSHWSRSWEYPYALSYGRSRQPRVLDAGCGFTAFKVALSKLNTKVYALDKNPHVEAHIEGVNARYKQGIKFMEADLTYIPVGEGFFPETYCLSVIEHDRNYDRIMQELLRVTKKRLILTMDVALNDMPMEWEQYFNLNTFYGFCSKWGIPYTVPDKTILTNRYGNLAVFGVVIDK